MRDFIEKAAVISLYPEKMDLAFKMQLQIFMLQDDVYL
jgi:hypothetical protein